MAGGYLRPRPARDVAGRTADALHGRAGAVHGDAEAVTQRCRCLAPSLRAQRSNPESLLGPGLLRCARNDAELACLPFSTRIGFEAAHPNSLSISSWEIATPTRFGPSSRSGVVLGAASSAAS